MNRFQINLVAFKAALYTCAIYLRLLTEYQCSSAE